jgi:3-phytase/alkaline phosphatase D
MLGEPQKQDLLDDLFFAEAFGVTWKFVVIPEPIQNLGSPEAADRFEGYAHERGEILEFIRDFGIRNVVFVAADIHGMVVNNLRYRPDGPDDDPVDVDAFEVTVPAVAVHPPLGPAVVEAVAVTPIKPEAYAQLSMDAQDDVIQEGLDDLLADEGHDPTGLDGSTLDASLVEGRWVRANAFGWTEFEIEAVTGRLTVTTWGIAYYEPPDVLDAADDQPFVLSRFVVYPK